jgi:hypothetical protein
MFVLGLCVSLAACGGGGASTVKVVTAAGTRAALARLPWPVHTIRTGSPRVIAGRVVLGKGRHFRVVVVDGESHLRRILNALPAAYRHLLMPDFGSASLLGSGPLLFVSDAGRAGTPRAQRRRELGASFELEEQLCRYSSPTPCPAV